MRPRQFKFLPTVIRLSIMLTALGIFSPGVAVAAADSSTLDCVDPLTSVLPPPAPPLPWLAAEAPKNFWRDGHHVRAYFDWLRAELNLSDDDWFLKLTPDLIRRHHGSGLLDTWPLRRALFQAYPESRIAFINQSWDDPNDRRNALLELGRLKGWTSLADWYRFSRRDFELIGRGVSLGNFYGTRVDVLKFLFGGDVEIEEWKFASTPPKLWRNRENRRRYFADLEKQLGITAPEDWYGLRYDVFKDVGGKGMFTTFYGSSMFEMLKDLRPDFDWKPEPFFNDLKSQRAVYDALGTWLPCQTLKWNHRFKELRFPETQKSIEIDIFMPDLNIGIEYQGEQHYRPVRRFGGAASHAAQVKRDAIKKSLFEASGRRLVEIPYWWDKTLAQLKSLVTETLGAAEVRRIERLCAGPG